jgi:predicted dehydrogenase
VVATGGIANAVSGDLKLLEDSTIAAVSSRSLPRAEAFAAEFGAASAYDDYEKLIADDAVDVVYVATPHPQHVPVVRAALLAGKAVLCEKAFTASLRDTVELVALARERGVFCMEAMWTRFTPLIKTVRELVAEGAIGEVRSIHADLGFLAPDDPSHRLWDPKLGGGVLLDVGIYPVGFAQMLLGVPEDIRVTGALTQRGVDAEAGLLLSWADGRRALLDASLISPLPGAGLIVGTKGRIEVEPRFHHPTRVTLVRTPERGVQESTVYENESEGRGYVPMLRAVAEAVREARTECPEMPLGDTIEIMQILQTSLDALGVTYPEPAPTSS